MDGTNKDCFTTVPYASTAVTTTSSDLSRPSPDLPRGIVRKCQDAIVRNGRNLPLKLADTVAQWGWFLFGIDPDRVGYGSGPLTWMRKHQVQELPRYRIRLLGAGPQSPRFAELTAWAINRSSALCAATTDGPLSEADVVWIYDQDPLSDTDLQKLKRLIARQVRPGTAIINPPDNYNIYHQTTAFPLLQAAGVAVPRFRFSHEDLDSTLVVYKAVGKQGKRKWLDYFDGERPGCKAFEYIHCRDDDGLYRRYRAHYFAGMVRGSEIMLARTWNVRSRSAVGVEYRFTPTLQEQEQVHLIARTLKLDYFAVDFLRRPENGQAVFTDINVFPTVQSPSHRVHARGDWCAWHTFDARARWGIPEPGGESVWHQFDRSIDALVQLSKTNAGNVSGVVGLPDDAVQDGG